MLGYIQKLVSVNGRSEKLGYRKTEFRTTLWGLFFLLDLKIGNFAAIIAEKLELVSCKLSFMYRILHAAIWQLQILGRCHTGNFYLSESPNLDMLFIYHSPECATALLTPS